MKRPSAHLRTPFPYLKNGVSHCPQIWYRVNDQLAMPFIHVTSGACPQARTCAPLFHTQGITSYLRNGGLHCPQIWSRINDQLAMPFIHATSGAYPQSRMCAPLFHIPGTIGLIELKCYVCVFFFLTGLSTMRFARVMGKRYLHIRTCKWVGACIHPF